MYPCNKTDMALSTDLPIFRATEAITTVNLASPSQFMLKISTFLTAHYNAEFNLQAGFLQDMICTTS